MSSAPEWHGTCWLILILTFDLLLWSSMPLDLRHNWVNMSSRRGHILCILTASFVGSYTYPARHRVLALACTHIHLYLS